MKFIKYPSLTNHYVARKQSFIDMEDEYVSMRKFMALTFLSSLITMTILTWLNVQLF